MMLQESLDISNWAQFIIVFPADPSFNQGGSRKEVPLWSEWFLGQLILDPLQRGSNKPSCCLDLSDDDFETKHIAIYNSNQFSRQTIISTLKVSYLMEYFFASPKQLPGTQLIAVASAESSPEFKENRGHLKCLSPEETHQLHKYIPSFQQLL